jgi:hypothetical protein
MDRDETERTVAQRWQPIVAWVLPTLTTLGCAVFFVGFALRAPWLTRLIDGSALSIATPIALGFLALIVAAVWLYDFIATRADRTAPSRDSR